MPHEAVVLDSKSHYKIVDKAFELPFVNDAYKKVSKYTSPLTPYVETVVNVATPYVESIKITAEENLLPVGMLDFANEQAAFAAENLDNLACVGLDQLTNKAPVLKAPTTELKDTAVSYYDYAKEYVASFGISQLALKLGDKGLQLATDALKLAGLDKSKPAKPVFRGIKKIRRNARAVRRAGAKVAGTTEPAKTIGEASILGALAEVLGFNFFLSVIGLQLVPSPVLESSHTHELDSSDEDEAPVQVKLSNDWMDNYVSEEDPDYVPELDEEEDSDEYDSDEEEEVDEPVNKKVLIKAGEKVQDVVVHNLVDVEDVVGDIVQKMGDVVDQVIDQIVDETATDKVKEIEEDVHKSAVLMEL